jgi:hypothetical protein
VPRLRYPSSGLSVLLALSAVFLSAPAAQWTIGIYMCADNGMNDVADVDLAEMKEVGSTEEVNVVVQIDKAARDPIPECRRYLVKKGGLDTLARLGEVDMADPATLVGFADYLRRHHPAVNYFLILWDHGNGWYPGYGPQRAIFIDETDGHEMGVAGGELAEAMEGVRQCLGKRVRILGFDACLMQMLEVAGEVSDACDFMAASEALEPSDGWAYDKLLEYVTARPTRGPDEILSDLCGDYVAAYPADSSVCLSGLDMRQLDKTLPWLAATLKDSLDAAAPALRSARESAQSFPTATFHVDLIDFLDLAGLSALALELADAVVANKATGLPGARGLAVWFPDNYLALKRYCEPYLTLQSESRTGWLAFLNRYFNSDELKPAQPVVLSHRLGRRGDLRLWWSRCPDLASVTYAVREATDPQEVFVDYGEELGQWTNAGWTTSAQQAHSGQRSFYSGTGDGLASSLESAEPLALPGGGLLSLYAYYGTEETWVEETGFSRDVCFVEVSPDRARWQVIDSLYGERRAWQELRYVLPGATSFLRFRCSYNSNGVNGIGVYLDDIKVYGFDTMRTVVAATADTSALIFGLGRNPAGYSYVVTAEDACGNVSRASQFYKVGVETWAEPYTRPAPFGGNCELVLDFPDGQTAEVLIYAMSGSLVRRLPASTDRVRAWDGKNGSGKNLADGLYLVVVRASSFKKLGKIAKVAQP